MRWGRRDSRRGIGSAGCGLAAAVFLLVGCGSSQTAAPPPEAPSNSTTAIPAPAPSASPSQPGADGWSADGPSLGVDRAAWPTTVKASRAVLDRLPHTFAGQTRGNYLTPGEDGSGAETGVDYGEDVTVTVSEEYTTDDTADGSRELMTARDLLVATFMLGLACSEDSYHGNALPRGDDGYPKVSAGKPVWFSCAVDAAEGEENFTAHAAGWTSGKTAWLVLAPDSDTVRSLVTALHDATS